MNQSYLLFDGKLTPASAKFKRLLTPGLMKGRGVFETILVRGKKPLFWKEHVQRLRGGLKCLGLQAIADRSLTHELVAILNRNHLTNARVRLVVWKQKERMHVGWVAEPLEGRSREKINQGFRATVARGRKNRTNTSHIKSIDYRRLRAAYEKAHTKGFDEAIFLNQDKQLVEGSRANIFFVKDRCLYTPALSCGCLGGIIRQQILCIARQRKIPLRIGHFSLGQLLASDEAFLTNSIVEIVPLMRINHQPIGKQRLGPVTKSLRKALFAICR
ncbi:MAG: aminotransferase class IV [Candidatus Omnitrophota bacterium]|nr:aminotransferase class IV [Candidatus Omnitrophota bacterium]